MDDSTAELRPVKLGQRQGELIVVEGVKAGERVVVQGQLGVTPEGKVAVAKPTTPAQSQAIRGPVQKRSPTTSPHRSSASSCRSTGWSW
jgi:hypothetical protein